LTTFVIMKKLLYLIFPIVLLGCDDGDIITNDFDFEDASVEACNPTAVNSTSNNFVFYKNENTNFESLMLQFTTNEDVLNVNGMYGPYPIDGSSSGFFEYRKFNAAPGLNYYCNNIPPSSPQIIEVYSAIAGTIRIKTEVRSDDDNDGIPADQEGAIFVDGVIDLIATTQDTDGDGILDYLDSDDDGDNIPTRIEGAIFDTDSDGILNYLDPDDDDDGVLTIQEDIDRDLDPTNDKSDPLAIANYLDNTKLNPATPPIDTFKIHTIERTTHLIISMEDLLLQNDREEIIFPTYAFGEFIKEAVELSCTPTFPVPTGSEVCIFQ
jgi:hypothetical protein